VSALQAVINVPTTAYKETKSAIKQVILNPELWDFKTEVSETTSSDHFGQTLHQHPDSLQHKKINPWITEQKFSLLLLSWVHFEPIFFKLFSQVWFSSS
jgi:hypothetical protein